MTSDELRETNHQLEVALARVDSKYKMLRRRAHIHRGDITGEQADQLRALLRGHTISADEALTLHPEDFFDLSGELDGGAVLWWLQSAAAKPRG